MSCEAYEANKEKIQRFTDGCLSEAEVQTLKGHCLSCPDCAAYLRELTALKETLKGALEETLPTELHEKIMKTIQNEKRRKAVRFRRFGIAAAAVLVLAVGTVAFLKSPASPIALYAKSNDAAKNVDEEVSNENAGFAYLTDNSEAASAVASPNGDPDQNGQDTAKKAGSVNQAEANSFTTTVAADFRAVEEYSETMDDNSLGLVREHLDEWTHELLSGSGEASFVEVVHMEMIPVELEHDDYRAAKFGVEDVSVVLTFGTEAELGGILTDAYPDWTYKTNDPRYAPALNTSADAENGLFIVLVPSGT